MIFVVRTSIFIDPFGNFHVVLHSLIWKCEQKGNSLSFKFHLFVFYLMKVQFMCVISFL